MRSPARYVFLALALLSASAWASSAAAAAEDTAAQRLADRFAPIVVVRNQSGPCDRGGEAYRPVPVETVLGRPEIVLLGDDGEVLTQGPTAQDLAGGGPKTSLDFPGNPRRPGCGFEEDFRRFGAGQPNVAYAHIATEAGVTDRIVLQYWFFWYFDDYVNTHEGDWEFIQIVLPGSSAAEALGATPLEVGYSQHSGGEHAAWTDDKLERQGDHPVDYAGTGSHANYFTSAVYLGRSANEGFGCDDTTGPSTRLTTEARALPSAAPDPASPLAWLLYEGRWGEFQPPPYDAPPGPRTKREWTTPITWQDDLRDSSFAIPASTTLGPTATGAFCSAVRVGGRVYTAVTSPLVLLLLLVGLVGTGTVAVRSTLWSPPMPTPLRRRRATGQMLRGAVGVYRVHRRTLIALGAVFVPAAIVEATLQEVVLRLTPLGALVETAGNDSLISAATALLVGGAGHLVAIAIVLSGVAAVIGELDAGRSVGVRDAYRLLGNRLGSSLGVVARVTATVVGLSLTVIGIPVAIYLLVRWAVAQQAGAIELLPSRAALRRSADLTRGRLWRTARPAALVNIVGVASGPVIGIVLLFTTGLPLATINAVSSLTFVVAMPFVGTAMALLYGDLVAAEEEAAISADAGR
jgi:hypothetical protein